MPYVSDKLVSPLSTPIVAYITNTTESWEPAGRGRYAKAAADEIWGRLKTELKNARRLGRSHRHHVQNALCSEAIAKNDASMKDYKPVFITSLSVDFTPIDERLKFYPTHPTGFDPYSNLARLPDEICKAITKYAEKFKDKYHQKPKLNHIFWPVCPFLFPYKYSYKEGKIIWAHPFPEAVEKTTGLMNELGYRPYGPFEKEMGSNEPQIGNFEWSELLVSPEAAKRAKIGILPGEGYDLRFVYNSIPFIADEKARETIEAYKAEHPLEFGKANILNLKEAGKIGYDSAYNDIIDWATFMNRQIIADFLEDSIIKPLQLKKLEIVAEKTGYVEDIFRLYGKKYEQSWWNVMENADMPREGVADKSAINRIIGVVWNDWYNWRT